VRYKGDLIDAGYRLDLVIDGCLLVELKSVEQLLPIHDAQVLTYLKLSDINLGLRINFNVVMLKQGIKRIVNKFPDSPSSCFAPLR
jgi:GxxExxY protein